MVLDATEASRSGRESSSRSVDLRDVPIITFVDKLAARGRDPFDRLDEVEQALALDVTPASRPIGMGRDFLFPPQGGAEREELIQQTISGT